MFNQDDSFFSNYGVESGYNQIAPGRDTAAPRVAGRPGRPRTNPVIQNAVAPPVTQPAPQQPAQPFKGAQQTVGATPQQPQTGIGTAIMGGGMQTQGGPANDPRWTNGTWGTRTSAPPTQAPAPAAPAAPNYNAVGQFTGRMHGYNAEKLQNSKHLTPKYQIGRVLSNFDPRQGITPEVISALNALNIGTFSGEGDKLTLGGNMHADYDGVGGTDDIITRFTGQGADPQWGAYTNEIGQAQQRAKRGLATRPLASLAPSFGSQYLDPSVMQNAILASGVPQSGDYAQRILQQIQAALSGGKL